MTPASTVLTSQRAEQRRCRRHTAFAVLSITHRMEEQRYRRHRAFTVLSIPNRREEQRRCTRHKAFTQLCH